jgi:hypothetical protein
LREQNRIIDELSSRLRKPPSEPAMAAQMPPVAYADYVFYSSKQDLLDATLPVRQKLNELGKTSMIIKGSKTPEACKTAIFAVYEHTMAYGHPLPFLVIVGNAYEDTADPRNIVGTFYYPDDEGNCFFSGGCASDVQIVDFDGDDLPDIPWTRILGTNVSEISNSVQAAVYYYNNQKIKPKRAFILDGDRTASCGSELEPRETLENIAAQYEAKGIPTVIKHASDYTACSDWAGKLADVSSIFAGGITEMLGTGLTTHRDALPGWIIQQRIAPVFTMSAVPYSQLFVAEFPGCELGGEDRLNPTYYPTIMQKFMTANPNTHANAVAWFGHKRGGWSADHLEFARRYFENRLAVYDNVTTLHHVYFNTIRELGLERPSLRGHLLLSGAYGWPVQLADMKPPTPPGGGGGGCHGCPPPQLDSPAPKVDTLNQNYPNPFNPSTTISFGLASPAKVTLVVYNVSGQRVATLLFNEDRAAGWHVSQWNGVDDHATPVATGIYFYRLTVGEKAMTRKMILIK